jgi:hypothetical protein
MTEKRKMYSKKMTMSVSKANIFSILLILPVFFFYFTPYYVLTFNESSIPDFKNSISDIAVEFGPFGLSLFILAITIFGIVIHELIHGFCWGIYAKNGFKSIKFGVVWKMMTPYCHCKEKLQVKQYIIGAIMPGVVLGLIPTVYAVINDNFGIFLLGVFFTMAAGGDIIMVYLLRNEKMNNLVQDHPSEMGCYVFGN